MSAAPLLCPQCQTPYEEGDFLCTNCELILDLDAAEANYKPNQPSIVRALLSPPQRRTGMRPSIPAALKKKGDPEVTVRAPMAIDELAVPRLLAGMNLALTPLHEFEAMVAAFVDGNSTVPQIAVAAEISRVEATAVFTSLVERGVIELRRPDPPKPPEPAAKAEPVAKAERREPATLPPGAVELPPEPPTPPPDQPLPPVVAEPVPPPRTRTPLPTDLPARRPAASPPPRPPPVMTPVSTPAVTAAPVMTPSRTPAVATPSRGVAVPTPVSTPARTPAQGTPGMPRVSQIQAPSPMASVPKAESVLERAISLERRGEVDGAIHVLKRAITQVKEPAALCNKLALILVNQRRDYRQAEELLNKAIELEPENAVYQQNLFKIIGMAAERRESRSSSGGPKTGGFLSKLLKK
jgi:hypothetical protein